MNKAIVIFLGILCWNCSQNPTERKQRNRNNIIHVKDRVKEIEMEDVPIGNFSKVHIIDDYLLIADYKSFDEIIHLFNKNTFAYVISTAPRGEGPGYITRLGGATMDEDHRKFLIDDAGKQKIFSYDLDSVLAASPSYMPEEKMITNPAEIPFRYQYFSDTLVIGIIMKPITPIGNYGFEIYTAKWNMNTGRIEKMKYEHPEIERKRVYVAASMEHGIYVECYNYHDLFTICSLDGELKYNVYGKKWNNRTSNEKSFFGHVEFYKDKIIALYSDGKDTFVYDKNGTPSGSWPTQFIVFDLQGNYIETLDIGYNMIGFCCDEENNRIIFSMDDEIQFGYLSLDGLID